jgi:hypothetical protein
MQFNLAVSHGSHMPSSDPGHRAKKNRSEGAIVAPRSPELR